MKPLIKSNKKIGKKAFRKSHTYLFKYLVSFLVSCLLISQNLYAFADYTKTICSGSPVNFAPAGNSSALTYTWSVPVILPVGAVNATQQATPQNSVNQTLTNSTAAPATVTYTVTASDATTFTLAVTVNPTPVLTNGTASSAICSGNNFFYTSASATTGTTITWSRALTNGLSPNTSNSSGSISEALTNTTEGALTATYQFVLTANGCSNTQSLAVIVYPTPTLNTTLTPAAVCSGSAFVYSPGSNQSPNINYSWTRASVAGISNAQATGTNSTNETLINTTLAAISVNYVYSLTNTATGCTNSQTVTVNVNPLPRLSSSTSNVTHCSGTTFSYTPVADVAGTAISWTRASIPGISPNSGLGNGNISEVLVNNSNLTPVAAIYQFTLNNAGCSNTQSFTITLNAKPALSSSLFPASICSGNTFTYQPTSLQSNISFAWNRNAVAGISNVSGPGADNPNETLTNTTLLFVPVIYAYTLTNAITGCTNSQNVKVNVNPIPSISNTAVNSCNSQGFQQYFPAAPIGTTYTWTTPVISPAAAITGGAAQAIGLPYVGQTLNNTSGASATATYTVTPNTFGCIGSTFSVTVTVGNVITAVIPISSSLTPPAICSGTAFNYIAKSTAPGYTVSWQRYYAAGISNALASGTNDPNEILTNTTTSPVTVSYGFTIASGGCASTYTVMVQVNPATQLSSTLTPAAICSNTVFNYNPTSNTPSTNAFNWTRAVINGITNGNGAGANSPNETLINTTTSPIAVKYIYTLNTASLCAHIDTVSVVVNPAPILSSSLTPSAQCSGLVFSYIPTSNTTGAIFSWVRPSLTGISNPTASGIDNPAELLGNTTTNTINVLYNYTITANTCTHIQTVTLLVKPVPVIATQTITICSGETITISPVTVPASTQYTWAMPVSNPAGILVGTSGTLQSSVIQTLNNASLLSAVATYTVTPIANGCTGNTFSIAATVNPKPVVADHVLAAICSGTAFSYTPANIPTATTFSWGNPVVSVLAGLSGGNAQLAQSVISQTLTTSNAITNNVIYTVTPSANSCEGNTFQLTVPVNPTPIIANQLQSICSGNSFVVTPTNVAAGTNYTWNAPAQSPIGTISGASAQSTPVVSITQLLSNTTTRAAQVVYTVVPASGACNGLAFNLTVTVNPATRLNLSVNPPAMCSNTLFSYEAGSNTSGTTFQWTRAVIPGISNAAASNINNPNEILVNNSNLPVNVIYTYTLTTAANCTNTEVVTVTINPTPVLTSLTTVSGVCSGTPLSYFPTSNVVGATFNWSRGIHTFITNASASGTNDPAEILVNTSVNTVNVNYTFSLLAYGCTNQQIVIVPIRPTPNITNQQVTACSNSAFTLAPADVPTGTQYAWSMPVYTPLGTITGGSIQTNQTVISEVLTNQTLANAIATYTVTPIAGTCNGMPFTVAVTIKPLPSVTNFISNAICSGTAFSYTPANVPIGTNYTWANPVLSSLNSLTGGSAQSISQFTISQTLRSTNNLINTAVYTVTPILNNCSGNIFTVTVPVHPTPVINDIYDTICTGGTIAIVPSLVPLNTKYTWELPAIQPFGAVLGASAQAIPSGNLNQTLLNTTIAPARLAYVVTPIAGTCAGNRFNLLVSVGAILPALANQAAEICSGTSFNASPTNAPAGTTYTWTLPAIIPASGISGMSNAVYGQPAVSEILKNTTATNSKAIYTVTAKNTGCISNTFLATVTVLPVPRVTLLGSNVICRYPFDSLTIDFTGAAPWAFSFAEDSMAAQTISGITTSPYTLLLPASSHTIRTFSFTNISHGACLNTTDTSYFSQRINPLPIGILNSLHGIYLCKNVADTLFITSPDSLQYQWIHNGSLLANATNDTLETVLPGRYNASITNGYGCTDTLAIPIQLYKINEPILGLQYDTHCIGVQTNFTNSTDTNTIGPTNWQWTFGDGNTRTGYHSYHTYQVGGDQHIRLLASQLNCPAYPTFLDTTLDLHIPIQGVTMPSVSAYKAVSTPISVRTIANYRYQWTPSWGIDFMFNPTVNFNYTNTQQYVINLISPAGCITQDSLLVRVFDDQLVQIMVPKSFTPNNDGVNDKLYPYLAGIKDFSYFKIYNRFNQLMFETKNYDEGWNGSLNGIAQPMGIYIWVASGTANDGSKVQRSGQTLLLR